MTRMVPRRPPVRGVRLRMAAVLSFNGSARSNGSAAGSGDTGDGTLSPDGSGARRGARSRSCATMTSCGSSICESASCNLNCMGSPWRCVADILVCPCTGRHRALTTPRPYDEKYEAGEPDFALSVRFMGADFLRLDRSRISDPEVRNSRSSLHSISEFMFF